METGASGIGEIGIMKIGRERGNVRVYNITILNRYVKTYHVVNFKYLWFVIHEFYFHKPIIKINISIIHQNYSK